MSNLSLATRLRLIILSVGALLFPFGWELVILSSSSASASKPVILRWLVVRVSRTCPAQPRHLTKGKELLFAQATWWALGAFIDGHPATRWFSSEIARTELARTVRRVNHDDRGRLIDEQRLRAELDYAERIWERLDLIAVSTRILTEAAAVEQPFLRTLDAIHLAAAVSLRASLSAFVTYDKRLAAVAQEVGLPVQSPS